MPPPDDAEALDQLPPSLRIGKRHLQCSFKFRSKIIGNFDRHAGRPGRRVPIVFLDAGHRHRAALEHLVQDVDGADDDFAHLGLIVERDPEAAQADIHRLKENVRVRRGVDQDNEGGVREPR